LGNRGESVNAIISELKRMEIVAPKDAENLERWRHPAHVSLGG
jgi:hypothetical protein